MKNERTIIGEVSVAVKTGLYVDDTTANICLDLLNIYFKNLGWRGVVLKFNHDRTDMGMQSLLTDEAVDVAMAAPWSCKKGETKNE